MSTRVCCIWRCVGTGALVYCCRRIQEQIVCSERYAQPHPESSKRSCACMKEVHHLGVAGMRLDAMLHVPVCQ